jgi:predicted  nucleic acid-binding Zn-ribbon protein
MTHLNALQVRLSNERNYLAKAKSEGERALRKVWIAQIEKEIIFEQTHTFSDTEIEMTEDELLAALSD